MPSLDIFKQDAFSVVRLTDSINKIKAVPGRIAQMGIFFESSVDTTTVVIEEKDGVLELASPLPRGGPGQTLPKNPATARPFVVPHFQFDDAIMADEVQNVRAFGSETEVETVAGKVAERQMIHRESLLATKEFNRVGALSGIITYADGTTKNLFTEFGVTPADPVYLDLEGEDPVMGALDAGMSDVAVTMARALGGTPFSGIYALAGRLFYRKLRSHPEVRELYKATPNAAQMGQAIFLPSQVSFSQPFEFGGIIVEAYRGYKPNGDPFIPDDVAYAFPIGVPRLFRTYMAPADYNETVNTMGRELYTKQWDWPNDKGVALESQMNSLDICTRPGALVTLDAGPEA